MAAVGAGAEEAEAAGEGAGAGGACSAKRMKPTVEGAVVEPRRAEEGAKEEEDAEEELLEAMESGEAL